MGCQFTPDTIAAHVSNAPLNGALKEIAAVRRQQAKIDLLVTRYVADALQAVGIRKPELGMLSDIDACHQTLQSRGIPISKSWWVQLLAKIADTGAADKESCASVLEELRGDLPFYEIELSLIERVGERLEELIKTDGTSAIVQTLFGDDVMFRWYTKSVTYDVFNQLSRETLRCLLSQRDQPIRVIEVGAGTGGMTANLLDLFRPDQTQYLFTDVGKYFLRSARRRFEAFPFVEYQRLDLEQSYCEQGFLENSCDLVIANNVIHDTKNVAFTLENLRKTLSPGGMLLMLELTDPQSWWHMCFGSLDGWWRFKSDPSDTREDLMLLKRGEWLDLLSDSGFAETAVLSDQLPCDFANRLFLSQTST